MLRLFLVFVLALAASADVSHLSRHARLTTFGKNRPFVAASPPVSSGLGRQIAIVKQSQEVEADGSYQFSFEAENGIGAEEQGQVRAAGNELEKAAQGSFHWTSPEGEQVSISYIADANGYQPQGSHLPVAPPIPPAILRSLEWNAAHPEPEERSNAYGQKRY